MVETLGMLAIVGILSMAGITGYNSAMDRYKANTLIGEAQRRAVVVAGQIGLNGQTPSLTEFEPYKNTSAGIFDNKVYYEADGLNKQFGIKVEGVEKSVCQNVLNTIGGTSPIRRLAKDGLLTTPIAGCDEGKSAYVIIYNNDMQGGTNDTQYCESDENCQTACGKCNISSHLCENECEIKSEECTTNDECENAGVCAGCLIPEGKPKGTCQYMCKPVDYLESTGTQYIALIIGEVDNTYGLKMTYSMKYEGDEYPAGFSTTNNKRFLFFSPYGGYYWQFGYGTKGTTSGATTEFSVDDYPYGLDNFYTASLNYLNNGYYSFGSATLYPISTAGQIFTNVDFYLFKSHNRSIRVRIKNAILTKGSEIIKNVVPVLAPKRNDIGQEPAMFDKVNNELYYNAGTGTFDYGPK